MLKGPEFKSPSTEIKRSLKYSYYNWEGGNNPNFIVISMPFLSIRVFFLFFFSLTCILILGRNFSVNH